MAEIITQAPRQDIAHRDEPGSLSDDRSRFALLREALINPDVQPDKAVAMADLMFRIEDRQREANFIQAKVAAISEMPRMGKDGENTHTKTRYARWETMQPIITPVLARNGLVLNFEIGDRAGKVSITPILSGHGWTERGGEMVLPADIGKGRNDVQAVASSASYGKRHAAMAMLNIVQGGIAEDDDGNAAGGTPEDRATPEQRELIAAGRSAAMHGTEAYSAWFGALPAAAKGWFAFEPHHAACKDAAALADNH